MSPLLSLAASLPFLAQGPATLDAMRWHRRVLVVSVPALTTPALAEQRRLLAGWRKGAADRDLTVVELIGDHVTGTTDEAATLRRRLRLSTNRFEAALVGKDGHVALRSETPMTGTALETTIDAMPMRRAGQR